MTMRVFTLYTMALTYNICNMHSIQCGFRLSNVLQKLFSIMTTEI